MDHLKIESKYSHGIGFHIEENEISVGCVFGSDSIEEAGGDFVGRWYREL